MKSCSAHFGGELLEVYDTYAKILNNDILMYTWGL